MNPKAKLALFFFFSLGIILFFPPAILAQKSRLVNGVETAVANEGKTRALIIGISKYQFIDSLEYADRDAQVFAEYLRNNNFWHVDKDDITLLVNDKARNGDLITQLARIAKASNPGDNLLFYFSGHGDVETITQFNNGYLLAYDTYNNNYIAGALPISFLKELFVTLLNKNVKVLLVTDACRSGKLAGGMKGAEFAASAISNMWKNEIKILSSQPGQLSFEGTKWGNGRGVFSYYLVKGLLGEGDANKDSSITLAELEMYVGGNVARETGNKQQPIFEGPNKYSTILAQVSPLPINANAKPGGNSYKNRRKSFYLPIDSCNHYYEKMKAAIDAKKFDAEDPLSATPLYIKFKKCSTDTPLILQANSQLLAALMNSTQDIVNNSFAGQKLVRNEDFTRGKSLIGQILQNNDLQLPYEHHLNNLNRYFMVMQATTEDSTNNPLFIDSLELLIDLALEEEPDAAYLLTAKSRLEMKRENWEKAIELQNESLEKSPGWLTPKYYLGIAYANQKSFEKAMAFYEEVFQKDSLNQTFDCTKCALKNMADWARKLKMDKKSEEYFLKSIQFTPPVPETPDPFEFNFMFTTKDSAGKRIIMNNFMNTRDPAFSDSLKKSIENMLGSLPIPGFVLDSMMAHADHETDLAGYYYMRSIQLRNKPGLEDSVTLLLRKAADNEPDEFYYVVSLLENLEAAGKDKEVQSLIVARMKNYDPDEQFELKIRLASSYLRTRMLKESFSVYKGLVEEGNFTCKELDHLKKEFEKLTEYKAFMKGCKDKKEQEED